MATLEFRRVCQANEGGKIVLIHGREILETDLNQGHQDGVSG